VLLGLNLFWYSIHEKIKMLRWICLFHELCDFVYHVYVEIINEWCIIEIITRRVNNLQKV